MSMPFYVAPEQVMKDRADYARKGIARGRALVALICDEGILICAENPSSSLRKISEIYDRIAFAGVGRYNEFDQLRIAGVRHADLKGYSFSREDVDARSLANQYAQILGQIFTHEMKPMEVEILVAEVGAHSAPDQLFHILYDGTVIDENRSAVLGGDAESIAERVAANRSDGLDLAAALRVAVDALAGPDRTLGAADLEVALIDRAAARRCFRRLRRRRGRGPALPYRRGGPTPLVRTAALTAPPCPEGPERAGERPADLLRPTEPVHRLTGGASGVSGRRRLAGGVLSALMLIAGSGCGLSGSSGHTGRRTTTSADRPGAPTTAEPDGHRHERPTRHDPPHRVVRHRWSPDLVPTRRCGGRRSVDQPVLQPVRRLAGRHQDDHHRRIDQAPVGEVAVGPPAGAARHLHPFGSPHRHADHRASTLLGPPAIARGDRLKRDLLVRFRQFDAELSRLTQQVRSADPTDPTTFTATVRSAAQAFQDNVATIGDSFAAIDTTYPDPGFQSALRSSCAFLGP